MLTTHGVKHFMENNCYDKNVKHALESALQIIEQERQDNKKLSDYINNYIDDTEKFVPLGKGGRLMILKGESLAIHKLGNIGRESDEKIVVHHESENYYMGNFVEGFGFINVKFAKSDVRPLTREEIDKQNEMVYTINGQHLFQYCLDYDGYSKE